MEVQPPYKIGSLASTSDSQSKQAKGQVSVTTFQNNTAGAHYLGFLVDLRVYEFQSFVSQCFHLIVVRAACCINTLINF